MNNLHLSTKSSLEALLLTKNQSLQVLENIPITSNNDFYSSFQEILSAHDIVLNEIVEEEKALNKKLAQIEEDSKINNYCDKWDYVTAATSGALAGLIDIIFVGSPTDSKWLSSADNIMNSIVQKFAKLYGWKGPKKGSNPTKSAISFLERKFRVNYDHVHGKVLNELLEMTPKNHHLKSLSHSPGPIGLIFSIIDQFRGTASFIDDGRLITVTSEGTLQGSNFISKLFSAFTNWLGHIMSDIAGANGSSGRGSGVPIPFFELLQTLNIGEFEHNGEKKHFADLAVKVFEQGYDFRFGMVLSVPVLLVELFNRLMCIIRHRYEYQRPWSECLQFLNFDKNPKLRKMLLIGQGTLCLCDAGHAAYKSWGNWVVFFSQLNFVAWARFAYLGLRHGVSILENEINIQRFKLRANAFDIHWKNITEINSKFFEAHNRKIDKFFSDRQQELELLTSSLQKAAIENDPLSGLEAAQKMGEMYGFTRHNHLTFEEFERLIEEDEY